MASKELIEKVAREMQTALDTGLPWHLEREDEQDFYRKLAKAAISTILAALQEPTERMTDVIPVPYRCGRDWRQDAKATFLAMLNASPLGEQSE